ncbi:hypothetical protein Cal7507_1643 [Calothrix sp. PCC 7507]|nr:hypothetical protein Cal7507_1643 [Calothrix sp. PCC 7507]
MVGARHCRALIINIYNALNYGFFYAKLYLTSISKLLSADPSVKICKNTPTPANRIRGYTDKTHLRGFQIPKVRVGGLGLCSRDF